MSHNDTVSRRTFLAGAGALPLVISAGAAAAQRKPIPVGLELYSVRTELTNDLLGTVSAVAKMGYQAVEFYSSTHNPATAFSGDPLQRAIELNDILGSKLISMASPPPKLVTVDAWKALADTCTKATERLRSVGMTAGFHNHATEWREVEGQRPMEILASGTPRDFVLQLDIGTCVQAGADPVAWINAHPGRVRSIHCKDWGAGEGRGYAVAFGEGDAPWLRIFEAAESVGGIEHYLIEQEVSPPGGQFAMAQRCLDNYRKLRA
jgi:hypothetical protein